MKVVTARIGDITKYEDPIHLFQTEENLKCGDMILVAFDGREISAICERDSTDIPESTLLYLRFLAGYPWPLNNVIGKMERWDGRDKI